MPKSLVIVESPTKARTIGKYLGSGYEVKASYGHVRDLPNSAAEIPKERKKEKWTRLGVNIERDFEPLYVIPHGKEKHVKELKGALKGAREVLLATDEDREGESISWHLLELLKPKVPVKRMVFHEITQEAIDGSLKNPRQLDLNLVKAQETRRIVDRLFGYQVSPLLWKKIAPRLSAGRVQSVALRLLVERERERIAFKAAEYWDLKATFAKASAQDQSFEASLYAVDGRRVASGKDFIPLSGKLDPKSNAVLLNQAQSEELRRRLLKETPKVAAVDEKPYTAKPPPPFITSTLQQEASRQLGFGARHTMSVAQRLYEHGLITYMRTDSTTLSDEALHGARDVIRREFGAEYLSPEPRLYKTKVRNAQEAHEAIRPAGAQFADPAMVRHKFGEEAGRLYELIWKRTLASQMKDSRGLRINVDIECGNALFKAAGKTIQFAGYLRAYVEGSDDPEGELADREKLLPKLSVAEELKITAMEALQHTTQPPPRYTEGSLIKELERLGIGRPSTWASIVDLVLSRTYAFKRNGALVPTFLALALTRLMERYFTHLMDYEFTARLEDDLDAIARGEAHNLAYLKSFYFGDGHSGLKRMIEYGEEKIDPREVCGIPIGVDSEGRAVEVRIGRYGPFITNGEQRVSVPDGLAPDELTVEKAEQLLADTTRKSDLLGKHPANDLPVYLKRGRFGPYVQLGDQEEGGSKPKMVSLLPGMNAEEVTLDVALKLLSLPRLLGFNPENNQEVYIAQGRYGPYLKCGSETRSMPQGGVSPLEITLEQALEILRLPRGRRRASTSSVIKVLGSHESSGAVLTLKSGQYGPYVTDGTLNASLPKDVNPEAVTLAEAQELLERKALASPTKKARRVKESVSKKAKKSSKKGK